MLLKDKPAIGLDSFQVYDTAGHLAPLNTGYY